MEANRRKSSIEKIVLPDEPTLISAKLNEAFETGCDIVITTGGTGLGPRDIAPETIKPLLDKEIPGIMEMVRMKYGREKPNALLSRALSFVRWRGKAQQNSQRMRAPNCPCRDHPPSTAQTPWPLHRPRRPQLPPQPRRVVQEQSITMRSWGRAHPIPLTRRLWSHPRLMVRTHRRTQLRT